MGEITVHCPKCASDDIREKNTAYAELRVTEWEIDDDLQPADYEAADTVDWEVEDVAKQYVCGACRWEGMLVDLTVVGDEDGGSDG